MDPTRTGLGTRRSGRTAGAGRDDAVVVGRAGLPDDGGAELERDSAIAGRRGGRALALAGRQAVRILTLPYMTAEASSMLEACPVLTPGAEECAPNDSRTGRYFGV